jgi:hypothetical protein
MRGMTGTMSLILIAASLASCERYKLDRQMEELCKKDGGVKVYEKVTLSPAEYEALSKFKVTARTTEDYYGPEYRYISDDKILSGTANGPQSDRGRLSRSREAIYRRADGRLLGESITYWRLGGDFFTFGSQPSARNCPSPRVSLQNSVFLKGE